MAGSIGAAAWAWADAVPPVAANPDSYVLGVNDEIEITVFGRSDTTVKTRIKEDGTITLPLIGNVQARDLTARQLAARIEEQLRAGGFFPRPVVSVDVTQYVSNSFNRSLPSSDIGS